MTCDEPTARNLRAFFAQMGTASIALRCRSPSRVRGSFPQPPAKSIPRGSVAKLGTLSFLYRSGGNRRRFIPSTDHHGKRVIVRPFVRHIHSVADFKQVPPWVARRKFHTARSGGCTRAVLPSSRICRCRSPARRCGRGLGQSACGACELGLIASPCSTPLGRWSSGGSRTYCTAAKPVGVSDATAIG